MPALPIPIRSTAGTRPGSGRPVEDREHAGSPTVWACAMRCAAATAVGEVYHVVVAAPLPSGCGVDVVGLGTGAEVVAAGRVVVSEGRVSGCGRVGAGVTDVCGAGGGLVVCGGTDVGRTVGRLVDGGVDVGEREVLDAVGSGVFDGDEGVEVGVGDSGVPAVSDGSVTDGDALAVAAESGDFPSESSSSHVPVPPRTRTAAPPAIHGARRDGRRCRFMVSLSHCPGDPAVVAGRTLRAGRG